jgi:two-component SAPR family response regulator
VAVGGRRVTVGGPKPRALLAVLVLDVGRVVSVDRLVDELWPGTPPETAKHAVQVYVSQLRKALGEVVAREGPGYVLEVEPDAIDVHRFSRMAQEGHDELREGRVTEAAETLRAALGLWRGPALVDFAYEPSHSRRSSASTICASRRSKTGSTPISHSAGTESSSRRSRHWSRRSRSESVPAPSSCARCISRDVR